MKAFLISSLMLVATLAVVAQPLQVSSLAGRQTPGAVDAVGDNAQFNSPTAIAVGPDGNVFVADSQNHAIRKVTSDGSVTTFAGLCGNAGSVDGNGTNAQFNALQGIAVDAAGFIYVADTGNATIRKITPSGDVSTLAGTAGYANVFDGVGADAQFNHPQGIAVDNTGSIYVADTWNNTVRKITAEGTVTTLAGLAGFPGSVDGPTNRARFNWPNGIAVDNTGTIFVTEFLNHTIRQIASDGTVTTIAGLSGSWGDADDTNTVARFLQPAGIASDGAGSLFVLDSGNHTIRQLTQIAGNWDVSTVAGVSGVAGDADGSGAAARTYFPTGLAASSNGLLYIADTGNNSIRVTFVPPKLRATSDGSTIALSWRNSASNYTAEMTFDLTPPVSWQSVTNIPVLTGDTFTITNPISGAQFYRLRAN